MFYAHIILAQKGPLARVWLAAHWDKKITKAHVFETNIEKSVEGIMQPKVKLALRTSGHLLLGVVRIYSRKAKYLLADCNEAFVKIKMAFRPGMVDLPEGHREANVNAITLPEVFHDFDTALPELNDIDIEAQFSINQSRADEITLREDYGSLSISLHDDGFGDIGFEGDTPDMMRGSTETKINDQLFENENTFIAPDANQAPKLNAADISNVPIDSDGFGDEFGHPHLFEDDLFGEPALNSNKEGQINLVANESEDDLCHFNDNVPSPVSSCPNSPPSIIENTDHNRNESLEDPRNEECEDAQMDQSILLQNEDESFALAPIDASAFKGITKTKRKRKLIVDEIKNISGEEMKAQLANTSDIVTTLDLAPPTKRLMYWKETGGVEKLFSLPSKSIPARALFKNYHRHLISHFTSLEDFTCLGPSDLLALDQIQNENEAFAIQTKRGRKRKHELLSNTQPQLENVVDSTLYSIAAPDIVREPGSSILSRVSLDIGVPQESLIPTVDGTIFEGIQSPVPMFSMNDINTIDHLDSLTDIPLSPGHMNNGMDSADDFNNGDLTPAELNHGHLTPHHPGIESIESIPNLPVDQVSSFLSEAENMPNKSKDCGNDQSVLDSDWNNYRLSTMVVQSNSEEQMENETTEQFEERVLNKRAAQLFFETKNRLIKQEWLLLSEFTLRNTRKQAAQKFYSLLVLKKFRVLNISQSSPYSDIVVSRGQLFDNPTL